MLLIKTKVKSSSVHGLGLFADEDISKNSVIWKFSPLLDIQIDEDDFEKLCQYEKDYINHFGYFSRKSNKYNLSFDDVRYINHSEQGNVTIDETKDEETEYPVIAARDIKKGEEILQNYYEFDDDHLF